MGLVAPKHVGSSRTRDWTHVSCISRWILLPVSHQGNPCFLMAFLLLNTWLVRLEINSSTKPCLTRTRSQPLCIHSHSTLCLVVSNHLLLFAWLSFLIDYIPGGKGHILGHHLAHNRCTKSICWVNDKWSYSYLRALVFKARSFDLRQISAVFENRIQCMHRDRGNIW